jgi:hypothetical protein
MDEEESSHVRKYQISLTKSGYPLLLIRQYTEETNSVLEKPTALLYNIGAGIGYHWINGFAFWTQNYWAFGLFPSSGVLESRNTMFRKLDLFPSSGEVALLRKS